MEKQNKLPEGVGKKIVEALKRQAEEAERAEQSFSEEALREEIPDYNFEETEQKDYLDYLEPETEKVAPEEETEEEESFADIFGKEEDVYTPVIPAIEKPSTPSEKQFLNTSNYPNVDLVNNLITKLPTGITKQTGARIIRQTMEAMGVSMNGVFTEAQKIQESLAGKIKGNIEKMEGYKNSIRGLEKEVKVCRKQSQELSELINLFIMSEKND